MYPTGADPNAPCASSTQVNTNTYTYNDALPYVGQNATVVQAISLLPMLISQSQTLYSVSFLALPETNATTTTSNTYTVRASLYIMSGTNSFALMAQSDQATLQASTLHGQFTEVYLQLQQSVYVPAATTVYLDTIVEQPDLVTLVCTAGNPQSYTSAGYTFASAQTSPASPEQRRARLPGRHSPICLIRCVIVSSLAVRGVVRAHVVVRGVVLRFLTQRRVGQAGRRRRWVEGWAGWTGELGWAGWRSGWVMAGRAEEAAGWGWAACGGEPA